jgi:hypothetical protein
LFIISLNLNSKNILKNLLRISIIYLLLITFAFTIKICFEFFYSDKKNLYYLPFLTWGLWFDVPAPRATGISRWFLILLIFVISSLFFDKKKKKFYFFFITILGGFIWLLQSRTTFYSMLIITSLIIFLDKKWIKNFNIYIIIIILQFLFAYFFVNAKNFYYVSKNIISQSNLDIKSNLYYFDKKTSKYRTLELSPDYNKLTTGRVEIWKKGFNQYYSKPISNQIIGFGPQADRYLIKQNASNGLLYVLICSGISGLFVFIILFFNLLKSILLVMKNNFKYDKYYVFSILLVIIFFLRSIVENSFTMFGLDYIFFINAVSYIICFSFQYKKNLSTSGFNLDKS